MKRGPSPLRWWHCGVAAVIAGLCVRAEEVGWDQGPHRVVRVEPTEPPYPVPEDPRKLLVVDEPMRRYFAKRMPSRDGSVEQLRQLADAIQGSGGLGFDYDAGATFAAPETFQRRRGNCTSYAFLLVAVAREFGMRASFQNVERAARWSRVGNLIVVARHLNVRVWTSDGTFVVDLEPGVVPNAKIGLMEPIADETAIAQFYSTVGFGELVRGRPEDALRYMQLATQQDPRCSVAWSNLAVLQGRLGDHDGARRSFEHALRANPREEMALDGYAGMLRRIGRPDDLKRADRMERQARRIRARNPYYQQFLAAEAVARNDLVEAEQLMRRAIALKRDEPEFFEQWVSILQQLGRTPDAQRAAKRLDRLRGALIARSRSNAR